MLGDDFWVLSFIIKHKGKYAWNKHESYTLYVFYYKEIQTQMTKKIWYLLFILISTIQAQVSFL